MPALKTLYIGGTGIISSASVRRGLAAGHDVTVLNRGRATPRPLPDGVESLVADIRDPGSVRDILGDRHFDVVVDFVAFAPDHVRTDVELFTGRTGQYVFISSASAYQTPPEHLPVTESTPLVNPYWPYSRDKIACEEVLQRAYREQGFPATIVRPSHTYDATSVPLLGGWTAVDRMRRGLPVVMHGDGSSLWVLTHTADFAAAFVGLLGRPDTVGDVVHITSDEVLRWDAIARAMGAAAGVDAEIVHVTSDRIAQLVPEWRPSLLGDRTHSVTFDNTKVKRLVPGFVAGIPFAAGAREIVDWYDADPARREVDPAVDRTLDQLVEAARSAG